MKSLYTIVFEDGTHFDGGNFYNTKWGEIPINKKIKRIFYLLPSGDYLTLAGYDEYYQMIEVAQDAIRMSKTKKTGKIEAKRMKAKPRLEYAYIMGKKNDYVVSYKISLKKGIARDILMTLHKADSDMIKKLNPKGWKS